MRVEKFIAQYKIEKSAWIADKQTFLIYFLLLNKEIVYVGYTSDRRLFQRLSEHKNGRGNTSKKEFDSFMRIYTFKNEAETKQIEDGIIGLIRPVQNIASMDHSRNTSVQAIMFLDEVAARVPVAYPVNEYDGEQIEEVKELTAKELKRMELTDKIYGWLNIIVPLIWCTYFILVYNFVDLGSTSFFESLKAIGALGVGLILFLLTMFDEIKPIANSMFDDECRFRPFFK